MASFEGTNLFAQQAANRRKSRWIVAAFIAFFAWLGFGADALIWMSAAGGSAVVPWQPGIPVLGIALSLVALGLVTYVRRNGAEKVLWATGARQLVVPETDAEQQFLNVAEEMAIASGVAMPRLWIVDDPDPNAFATGDDPARSHIAVTSGLLAALDRAELQAVVGHELAHVKNLDTKLMTFLAALVGAVLLMRDGVWRILRGGLGGRRRRSSRNDGKGQGALLAVLLAIWLISWILAPIVVRLLALWVSRKREFLADASSAQFTRNPLALASALAKIEAASQPTGAINAGVAHLCIADPLGRKLSGRSGALANALATHPPMEERIRRLRMMGFEVGPNG